MNKKIWVVGCLCIGLFSSCAESDRSSESEAEVTATEGVQNLPVATNGAAAPAGEVKLNPPHGEPGHRCEIAVGAPLDSEPEALPEPELTITPPSAQPQFQPQLQTPQTQPTESPAEMLAKGLNPPHGEEGHDCAIAVGAPLK